MTKTDANLHEENTTGEVPKFIQHLRKCARLKVSFLGCVTTMTLNLVFKPHPSGFLSGFIQILAKYLPALMETQAIWINCSRTKALCVGWGQRGVEMKLKKIVLRWYLSEDFIKCQITEHEKALKLKPRFTVEIKLSQRWMLKRAQLGDVLSFFSKPTFIEEIELFC